MDFLIRKNSHWSNKFFHKLFNFFNLEHRLSYVVTFDESCLYSINTEDRFDINKLFGFSSGFNHHKNSARIGWNSYNNKIHLHAYCYINGVRTIKFIRAIRVYEEYKMMICDRNDHYLFTVITTDNWITQIKISKTGKFKKGYKLWPYFGGNLKAPWNMLIELVKN